MFKYLILSTNLLFSTITVCQDGFKDFLVKESGERINCKIVKLESLDVSYLPEDGKPDKIKTKSIYDFKDMLISDTSVIVNPLGIKIEKPDTGFTHVYFYRSYSYNGSALPCNIDYNGKKIANIKTNSYFLHKIKIHETHIYNPSISKRDKVEIHAEEGAIYFIKCEYDVKNAGGMMSNSMTIALDNPKVARYAILNMKKISPTINSSKREVESFPMDGY